MRRVSFSLPLLPDRFVLMLIGTVAIASVFPCAGAVAKGLSAATSLAVALVFFLHGVRLSRRAILDGLMGWRLHGLILGTTYVLFPLAGLALVRGLHRFVSPELAIGLLYLCTLPSTVQSSVVMTSLGRGNVAAAVCAATTSNMLGILVTPALAALLLARHGAVSFHVLRAIVLQLFVPFAAGQALRGGLLGLLERQRKLVGMVDHYAVLLIVYTAFSAAVVTGIWRRLPPLDLAGLALTDALLLGLALLSTFSAVQFLGFAREERVTIVFCSTQKSLLTGLAMANLLFAAPVVGITVLPLMIYHQMQLIVSAGLARRFACTAAAE